MIAKPYFVILNSPEGAFVPLLNSSSNLAMFESEIAASVAGNRNVLGCSFGYEIFEIGGGNGGWKCQ